MEVVAFGYHRHLIIGVAQIAFGAFVSTREHVTRYDAVMDGIVVYVAFKYRSKIGTHFCDDISRCSDFASVTATSVSVSSRPVDRSLPMRNRVVASRVHTMSPLLTGLYIANLDSCVAGGVGAFKYHVFNALDRCEAAALAYAQIYLSVGKLLQKLYGFVKLVDAGLSMLSKSGASGAESKPVMNMSRGAAPEPELCCKDVDAIVPIIRSQAGAVEPVCGR